jgi:7-cyano-7-deazaguanine synthase
MAIPFWYDTFLKEVAMKKKAVVLFSGGLDSTTCLAIAKSQGFDCYALSFAYGQKHSVELECAKNLAKNLKVTQHKIVTVSLNDLGGSALLDNAVSVPDYKAGASIPSTYVPARNTIFLSLALGWAEALGAFDIFLGANVMDYSGYPDCRPEYLQAFEAMANLGTKAGVEGIRFTIHAPLLKLTKAEIIREGIRLGLDYSMTVSCYRADEKGRACGNCDSCVFRKKGFIEAGIEDVTTYQ